MQQKNLVQLNNVRIEVEKSTYTLNLFCDTVLVKSYKAVFGRNSTDIKTSATDDVTPVGSYKICSMDTATHYHKFLQINYPNKNDAAEAFRIGLINSMEYMKINLAHDNNQCPSNETHLGANIGIHGIGEYDFIFRNLPFVFNWTNGSIAVSNDNIDELYSVVNIGTPVIIRH